MVSKSVEEFYVREDSKDGRRNDCILCCRKKKREYILKNSELRKEQSRQYRLRHPDYMKGWNERNREKKLQGIKDWRKNNPEKNKLYKSNYRVKKTKEDPKYRLKNNIRRLILLTFTNKGYTKKSKTNEILGIDYDGFMKHIESLFTEGMTWENRGKWEIDHKIPISLGKTEDDIIKLNHYTNLQPLWREDNIKKSNKMLY